jgi:hypothetical protein
VDASLSKMNVMITFALIGAEFISHMGSSNTDASAAKREIPGDWLLDAVYVG